MTVQEVNRLGFVTGGRARLSASGKYLDTHSPSTGEMIAQAPDCVRGEIDFAVASAFAGISPFDFSAMIPVR